MAQMKWNFKAFEQIRRLPGVKAALKAEVDAIAASAGPGYVSHVDEGKTRSRGSVVTGDAKAIRDNSKNSTLLRALQARGI